MSFLDDMFDIDVLDIVGKEADVTLPAVETLGNKENVSRTAPAAAAVVLIDDDNPFLAVLQDSEDGFNICDSPPEWAMHLQAGEPTKPMGRRGPRQTKATKFNLERLKKETMRSAAARAAAAILVPDEDEVGELGEESEEMADTPDAGDNLLRIRLLLDKKVEKFEISRSEPLTALIKWAAQRTGKPLECISFFFKKKDVDPSQSPRELGMEDYDILECSVLEAPLGAIVNEDSGGAGDSLSIFIQFKDTRKRHNFSIPKDGSFIDFLPPSFASKRFQFDGAVISLASSPAALDMDSGDCIDCLDSSD